MPCNFRAELTLAVNSNQALKAIHQKYSALTGEIILKMADSKYKYNSKAYLKKYLTLTKPLITDFTIAEKLLIVAMELDNLQLEKIIPDCTNFKYILAELMDRKFLHKTRAD